jgi:hypothetical protein
MNGVAARGLGRFQALPRYRRWAALASLVWIVVVVSYAIGFLGSDGPASRGTIFIDGLFFLIALILPLLLVWLSARFAEELERQREAIAALAEVTPPLVEALQATRAALDRHGAASPQAIEAAVQSGVRQWMAASGNAQRTADPHPALAGLAEAQGRLEAAVREMLERAGAPALAPAPAEPEAPARPAARKGPVTRRKPTPEPKPAGAAAEPVLPLLSEAEAQPDPGWSDLVRALNFPRDEHDQDGFRALKAVLRHRGLAQMLQAAEDVLTLLSQKGIYVDDLAVDAGDPAAWRRFIAGVRGPEVAGIGQVQDAAAVETVRGLMKGDPIFRDTALFFHRRFDAVLVEFASDAEDERLLELIDTRSGRAFMLLARLNGAFG